MTVKQFVVRRIAVYLVKTISNYKYKQSYYLSFTTSLLKHVMYRSYIYIYIYVCNENLGTKIFGDFNKNCITFI